MYELTDITATKSTVEQLTRHVETLLDNQQPVLQFLQSNLTAMNRLGQLQLLITILSKLIFRLDALALSVIATATWLAGWVAGWLGGCLSQPVLYQND